MRFQVLAPVDHLVKSRGAQPGMPIQGLANELQIRIGDRGAQQRGALEAAGFDRMANGIGVNAQCLRQCAFKFLRQWAFKFLRRWIIW